jgi:hypothetical protein
MWITGGREAPVLDEAQLHELAVEILHVGINELLGGEDFFELAVVGFRLCSRLASTQRWR